jgi:ribosomal-protein-alanine N-acetyltransferase
MFEKFKQWFLNNQRQQQRQKIADVMRFKNAVEKINGETYFIAHAQITDIPEILQVEQQVYGATPWNESAFSQEIRRTQDRLYLVVRKNDRLVAFAGCSFSYTKNEAHITNIAVVPEFQSHGIGRFLIRKMMRKAVLLDMEVMSLEVRISNVDAQRLYKKNGLFTWKG